MRVIHLCAFKYISIFQTDIFTIFKRGKTKKKFSLHIVYQTFCLTQNQYDYLIYLLLQITEITLRQFKFTFLKLNLLNNRHHLTIFLKRYLNFLA